VVKEIAVEAVLENCRALIKQIKAVLSAEKRRYGSRSGKPRTELRTQ
jgi:hypothetical protein